MSGNALHKVFAFSHPHVKYVITASLHSAAHEDDLTVSSVQDGPRAQLLRQAAKISQGKQVDSITTLLPAASSSTPNAPS